MIIGRLWVGLEIMWLVWCCLMFYIKYNNLYVWIVNFFVFLFILCINWGVSFFVDINFVNGCIYV